MSDQTGEDRYRLLLIEDNPAHARLVGEMLRGTPCEGSSITHAASLSKGLEELKLGDFDLVLLDLGLPESRGMETFTRFYTAAPTQPVVVLTSLDDGQIALEAVKAGAEDFLPKDNMAGSLCRTIRHAIERSRLSNRLMEREQQLRTIFNRSLDGMVVIGSLGKVHFANPAATRMLGADGAGRLMFQIRQATNLEAPINLTFDPDEGPKILAEVRITGIPWDNKPHYLVSMRDITLRQRIEDNLRQSQKMEMIGTLTSGIAHDFNNILTAVSGLAQFMANSSKVDEEFKQDALSILGAVDRGNYMIRDLLRLSRPQDIQKVEVDLNALMRKTEGLIAATIRKTHQLHVVYAQQPCVVQAAPESLEQVVINLVMNARDATPQQGQLTIEIDSILKTEPFPAVKGDAPPGYYALIRICDKGTGMPPEVRDRIFEPFFTTKEPGKGTGLGMFIVYGIVEQHGGWIVCDSTPGMGTTFEIYLKREEPEAP